MTYASTLPATQSADRCFTPAGLATAYFPHRSAATIKKDLSRAPETLPPFFRVGRQTLFRESQVLAWLDEQQAAWAAAAKKKKKPAEPELLEEPPPRATGGRRRIGGEK